MTPQHNLKDAAIEMLEALIYVENLCDLEYGAKEKVRDAIEKGQKSLTLTPDQQLS